MLYGFPPYDEPPAPQDPPQTYTPLSPPKSRHGRPSSSGSGRPTPKSASTDSHLRPQTSPTGAHGETGPKNKARTRVLSSSRPAATGSSFPKRSSGAKASLSPPTTMSSTGPRSVTLGRRRTLSAASVSERRDSVDARSIISSLLDAYCRSDATDDVRDDGASGVYSDEIASLANSSSMCNDRCRHGSNSTIVASELPTRRPKPASLLIEASLPWGSSASAPRSAPVAKNARPLPSPPTPCNSHRHSARPLPHLPFKPPPYTLTAGDNGASRSDIPPVPTLSLPCLSAPTSSGSTSVPTASSSTTSTDLSRALDRPIVSKYQSLPLLTIPSSPSSQQPSPLPSYIPVPPSPTTARRHQASKLSRILGEDISPEFLGPNRVSRLPSTTTSNSNVTAQPVNQRQTSKLRNDLTHPPARPTIQPRAVRPNAIYVHDDGISGKSTTTVGDRSKKDSEKTSFFDFTDDDDEEFIRQGGIKIDLSLEESDDTASSGDASEIMSPSGSILEEMNDMEEARIGRALQNVITYQKAARVKRTSRMWVLEKNGQRWEEQDHMYVRQVLRQL